MRQIGASLWCFLALICLAISQDDGGLDVDPEDPEALSQIGAIPLPEQYELESGPLGKPGDLRIFKEINNGYRGGAMVEIGQRFFTVEPENLFNVSLVPIDLVSKLQYREIKVPLSGPGLYIRSGMYLTDLGHGPEMILVYYDNEDLLGVKLSGDENVPAGEVNFRIHLSSMNGSITFASLGYMHPFQVEITMEMKGHTAFDLHLGKRVEEYEDDGDEYDYDYGASSPPLEYHMVDLVEDYWNGVGASPDISEYDLVNEASLEEIMPTLEEVYDTEDMPNYGTYDENLDYMYGDEDMTATSCPGCSLDTLSSRFSSSEGGAKLDVHSEITRQREELSRLRLALQNKEEQIESLSSNIQNLDNDINEALASTSSVNDLDEQISEMKEDKIRQVALIEDLESGRVLADCQKKSSVSEQRLARLMSLTENYRSIIGIEHEHQNSMQLIANDNVLFANLHKGLLERQAEQNERCQTTLNEQNDNMEELENEEKNLIDEKILIQREFEDQRARIETNIEREKSLRNVIENQKNTIEANRKKISILKKTVSDLSLHVPDCNITMVEDSESDLEFDYQISDLRSFNEESLTAYMDMTAALKENLDAQNESFTLCQETRKINIEELRSFSHLQGGNIHKIIKEVNSLLPADRQIIVPDVPLMSSLPQPPRDSQLHLHSITLICPPSHRQSSPTIIPYVDGDFVLPSFLPTCERKVTLRGGSRPSEGNVFFNGKPVCDDSWGYSEGKVVCRELGFPLGAARVTKESYFGSVSSSFGMDDVNCRGDEASLEDCYYKSYDDCGGSEGAGVVCQE